ncbi:hypothetical protein JHK82_030859 [Glycine max]|nr:hypothetical protein JHK82_030859 [Glycine max]KAG5145541.1 hypothetical protein JHK84_031084 [Glycine max]
MRRMEAFVFVFVAILLCGCVAAKECTNIPTQSHTFRYELLMSKNATWKAEVMDHYHLTPTDETVWADLLPRKFLSEQNQHDWGVMYRKIKNMGVFKSGEGFLKEVPLQDVRLHKDSIHARAQQTNLEYLLMLDVDSLIWSFRKTAGLSTPGTPYGGWEGPEVELRGHFVGHYLSASALMWASTQNDTLKQKMSSLVAGLSACQEKIGTGYLSAFPSEFFDRFETVQPVWAPYYTIHKILAGLLDQHTFAGNPQALKMVTWMVDYFYNRVQNVITKYTVNRHYESLNEETGGMNDVLYRLYSITGDSKHLVLAHLFDKPCFLGLLAMQANDIANFHANTHIPVVVGSQMRYEITGDPLYKQIGTFFMDLVNSSHSYATGGTSVSEFWSDPKRIADNLRTTENEESCTTYNMLKVSRHLFRWTKEVSYADYYERALTNGVLSIQRGTDPGVMIYMLPLGFAVSKARTGHSWGTQFDSFWCCYGTDDRPEYASVQAILYGPYLLAGHTTGGDWDLKAGANNADWITPIPASYNSQLVSFFRDFEGSTFVLTNSNKSVSMQKLPEYGTDLTLQATFRIVLKDSSSKFSTLADANDRSVMLEPFDFPGMNVIHQGAGKPLLIADSSHGGPSSVFLLVPGLDGRNETVSLESQSNKGCYVYSGMSPSSGVKLSCKSDSDATFNKATSFVALQGLSQYNPISFVAKGTNRNFLLQPLLSFRDEHYTVYFNIQD